MTSSLDIISKANVEKSIKGISIKKVDFWIFNRVIKELIPKIIKIFKGDKYRSNFIQNLAFGSYNKNINNKL